MTPSLRPASATLSRRILLIAASTITLGCGADRVVTPSARPSPAPALSQGADGSPTFLTADPAAPTIANPVIAFWAKKGVDQSVRMYYHARPGHTDSATFMVFRVRARSLQNRPDGSAIAAGDSVLITVSLTDPAQLKLDFQPSGLRFADGDQAVLKLNFGETLRDLNGDGVVNALDAAIQKTFRIWRKESLLDPWQPLSSQLLTETNEIQANIAGFTGYACAY